MEAPTNPLSYGGPTYVLCVYLGIVYLLTSSALLPTHRDCSKQIKIA